MLYGNNLFIIYNNIKGNNNILNRIGINSNYLNLVIILQDNSIRLE